MRVTLYKKKGGGEDGIRYKMCKFIAFTVEKEWNHIVLHK